MESNGSILLKSIVKGVVVLVFYMLGYFMVSQDTQETLAMWPVAVTIGVILIISDFLRNRKR